MKITVFFAIILLFVSCSRQLEERIPINSPEVSETEGLPDIPNEMTFCGQKIILKDEDIRERLDREVLINVYFHSSTIQSIKRANRYFPQIDKISKKQGILDDFKYLPVIESGLTQAVSTPGAKGFWQFMPLSAKDHDLPMNDEVDERLNIEKSTYAACDYLNYAHDTLGDWVLAAASYNRGIGGVRREMRGQDTDNYFDTYMNSETGPYVFRVLAVKMIFENPESFRYYIEKDQLYPTLRTKKVKIRESIQDLAEWSLNHGINYKILTKLNPWIL